LARIVGIGNFTTGAWLCIRLRSGNSRLVERVQVHSLSEDEKLSELVTLGNGLDWGVRTDPDGVHSFSFPSPPSAENVDEIGFDPTPSDSLTDPQEISVSEVSDSLAPFLGTVKPVFNPPDNDPEHTLHANSIKDFLIRNDAFVIEHGYNPTSQRPRRNPKYTVFYDPSKPSASMAIAPMILQFI
jgi:hypothetical protein